MSTALTTLMQRALVEMDVGFVVPNADISAFAATTFTAARFFQNTNMASDFLQVKNAGFVRAGAASSADFWRPSGTLTNTSGVVNQVGPSWADTTVGSEEIECWYYGVRRDQEVLKSLNRVLEFKFVTSMTLLSHLSISDGGMELSTDSNWTDVGTPTTSAKASVGPIGPRSYQLVADAANEGTRSAAVLMAQGRTASAWAVIAADAGTASVQLRDATNSADIGTAITHSERMPMLVMIQSQTIPATCKAVSLSLLGTVNPSTIYVNQAGITAHDNPLFRLPSFITEGFMAPRLYRGVPQVSIASNVYDAGSIDYQPLTEGQDYRLVINHADAQPYKVRILRPELMGGYPLFIEYRRPLSDLTTFSAESDSTTGPLHEIVPAFKLDLLRTVYNVGARQHPDLQRQINIATEEMQRASNARPKTSIGNPKPYWAPMLSAS